MFKSNFPNILLPPSVLSVAGLNGYIQSLLEQDQELLQVWVTGEVSSANAHRSGLFFTLQDPDTKAALRCIVWNTQLESLAMMPVPGEQVIVLGRIRLYPQRGEYQLVVWQSLPAGEGLLALRYRQLRDRLAAEGMFDLSRKQSLPPHPQTVAVVTSRQAAAWGDIQRTLQSRYPGLWVILSPAFVQGDQAPASIATAIQRVIQDGRAQVLLLSRGGGASEDLACFNDERVVRAIAECPIPVITGIGHERDQSLADLVADVCAHTPTAAAQRVVPDLLELKIQHQERVRSLISSLSICFNRAQGPLEQQRIRLQRLPLNLYLSQEIRTIARLKQQLIQAGRQQLQHQRSQQKLLAQTLHSLDPQVILERGYAVVRHSSGAVVRTAATLQLGEELRIQLASGQVKVKITELPPTVNEKA
jgi:exodeoxyribonuclease VII large subunit